jgi:hypothetical protein
VPVGVLKEASSASSGRKQGLPNLFPGKRKRVEENNYLGV